MKRSAGGKRLLVGLLVLAAIYYAVQGGEYSTITLFRQNARAALLQHAIDSLEQDIDSLKRLRQRILTDAATQERIAREEFGMVRGDKELLYRFVDRDSLRGRGR